MGFKNQIERKKLVSDRQILLAPGKELAFPHIIAQASTVVKAGTPVLADFEAPETTVSASEEPNGVVLFDYDSTKGDVNGVVLYEGIINLNAMEADVQALYTSEVKEILAATGIKVARRPYND